MKYKKFVKGIFLGGLGVVLWSWAIKFTIYPSEIVTVSSIIGTLEVKLLGDLWWDNVTLGIACLILLFYGVDMLYNLRGNKQSLNNDKERG